ncbi:MAG: NADH-quinone oxidoreductase subunit NuoB [Bacteriovoracia bacterium]
MGILENAFPEYVVFSQLDRAINWAKQNSLSFLTVDLACCGVEMHQAVASRYDISRFGSLPQVSPRQADLMIVGGTITYKVAEELKKTYEAMPYPKYVVSFGSCSNCGGMFSWEYSYSTVSGLDKILPVDIYIPGCPPRPEALLEGLLLLQTRISTERVLVHDDLRGES